MAITTFSLPVDIPWRRIAFSRDMIDKVACDRDEGESLRAITKDPAMPSLATVLKWVANDVEGFAKAESL